MRLYHVGGQLCVCWPSRLAGSMGHLQAQTVGSQATLHTRQHTCALAAVPCSHRLRCRQQQQPTLQPRGGPWLRSSRQCSSNRQTTCSSGSNGSSPPDSASPAGVGLVKGGALTKPEGASADLSVIWDRLVRLTLPYWTSSEEAGRARWRLAGVVALTLATTGVSVTFNFLGRDFFNAISEKDTERFYSMIVKWLCALCLGIPVFVFRDYYQSMLALEWREWMTRRITQQYFAEQTFYQVQAGSLVDNPDQRISSDVRQFTETALGFSMVILNSVVDLVSFSEILYTIYPPLFGALVAYSVGGTALSLRLGRPLVGLNFQQEAQEANFRYGLVRVRENAESIAFYGGEASEERLLFRRLRAVVDNYARLLATSRNLQFFTSFYRYLIQILPAAVVAPLFFQGKITFGVINQSSSAFSHILSDVSLVIYQFESLASFSAVIDRLGEFTEVLDASSLTARQATAQQRGATSDGAQSAPAAAEANGAAASGRDAAAEQPTASARAAAEVAGEFISLVDVDAAPAGGSGRALLEVEGLLLRPPGGAAVLVAGLDLRITQHQCLLIVGPSGAGKTSILRAIAGLWSSGRGTIRRYGRPIGRNGSAGDILFVPQRPYVVLGTLREQLLYPTWATLPASTSAASSAGQPQDASQGSAAAADGTTAAPPAQQARPLPSDAQLQAVLRQVRLAALLERETPPDAAASASNGAAGGRGLDCVADWASMLSLGEQQRLAFARVLLASPALVLMDESTSALDTANEEHLYRLLRQAGITYVSVGHRPTLTAFHDLVLRLQPHAAAGGGGAGQNGAGNGTGAAAAGGWELLSAKAVAAQAVL